MNQPSKTAVQLRADQGSGFQQDLSQLTQDHVFCLVLDQQLIKNQSSKSQHVFNLDCCKLMLVINRISTFAIKMTLTGKKVRPALVVLGV